MLDLKNLLKESGYNNTIAVHNGNTLIPFIFISGLKINQSKIDLSKCEIVKKPFYEYDLITAVKKFTSSPLYSQS
ncbi:MAG: hypothetical protein EHM47_03835 [Ignavibacteriales bacterium]|nr:MAG: hypothetical protein EHM47_03835 [Ignavibacteriales bacterium]